VHDIAGASADGAWRGLRVRIGIHTGPCLSDMDPTTKRIDYFGHAVNLAARVESLAEVGLCYVFGLLFDILDVLDVIFFSSFFF
jgi:adenylate cyclase